MRCRPMILMSATLGVVAALAWSCATKTVAPPAPTDTGPVADTPGNAAHRLEWAFNHGDFAAAAGLLTDDFTLAGSVVDTADSVSRVERGRGWVLVRLAALFGVAPGFTPPELQMVIDRFPFAFVDPRPGKDPRFHKQIRTTLDLKIRDQALGSRECTGTLLIYCTRGDSASIPAELSAAGVRPDSTVWWFDRIDDETTPGTMIQPSKIISFTQVLSFDYSR